MKSEFDFSKLKSRPNPYASKLKKPIQKMVRFALATILLVAALTAYALWPVCVPLAREDVMAFQPPITERQDTMLFGRVFREHSGQWYQCKTRISRAFFF